MPDAWVDDEDTVVTASPEVLVGERPAISALPEQHFTIGDKIGEGGWSSVYKGRHLRLNIDVAVKCLHTNLLSTAERLKRFEQEATIAGNLSHGNIVRVFDFGCMDEKRHYILMEFVNGQPLATLIENGPLSPELCARICLQIADALDYTHSKGVIHRDIKPGNVLLDLSLGDEQPVVKVADFGMVKALTPDDDQGLTRTGEIIGTPEYMSPEQCAGKPTDGRSDIYSLGVLMYECLTGTRPFIGKGDFECMRQHLEVPAPKLKLPAAPGSDEEKAWDHVIQCCLAKLPSARPTAPDMVHLLKLILTGKHIEVHRTLRSLRKRNRHKPLSKKALIAAGLLCSLTLLAVVLGSYFIHQSETKFQQTDFPPGESYEQLLVTSFDDIENGIKDMGNATEVNKIRRELTLLRESAAGHGTMHAASPVHVVTVGNATAKTNVLVTYDGPPIELVCRSLEPTEWNISTSKNARIAKVYLIEPIGKISSIRGLAAKTPVQTVEEEVAVKAVPTPYDRDRSSFEEMIASITKSPIATYQGNYNSSTVPWVVGPESNSWRAQMALSESQTLHARAMKATHEKLKKWVAQYKPEITLATSDGKLIVGTIQPPPVIQDYTAGIINPNWKIPSSSAFSYLPEHTLTPPPMVASLPKTVHLSEGTQFTLSPHGLVRMQGTVATAISMPTDFSGTDQDLTYDSKRNRILVKDHNAILSFDPQNTQWTKLVSDLQTQSQGLAYNAQDDCLYLLEHSGTDSAIASSVIKLSPDGKVVERVPLSQPIPLERQGEGFTQITSPAPYLVAVSSAPWESAKSQVPISLEMKERDPRKYLWIADPKSGRVLMSAPLEKAP